MPNLNVLRSHNVIVEAIATDLATIDDLTISGVTATNFDGHDSLGSAFYLYAYLKSGYSNLELSLPPQTMLMWVQDKVRHGDIGPYIDKELAAIGLGIFALCRYHKGCPDVRTQFTSLVEPHFDNNQGLYGNFLSSVLVALGLRAVDSEAQVLKKLESYIDHQLLHNENIVFNDPKNIVAAHIWAREIDSVELLRTIVNEAMERAARDDTLARDRVYYSYVLFEEIKAIPRKDRKKVGEWVLASLDYLYSYSVESVFSPDVVEEYSQDIVTTNVGMVEYGYTVKPRLSRIMLAVGLLTIRKYDLEGSVVFSSERQILRLVRGLFYPLIVLGLLALFIYITSKIGLPFSIGPDIKSGELARIATAICLKLPPDVVWASLVSVLLTWAGCLFYYIAWSADTDNEIVATKLTVDFLKRNWGVEVLLAGSGALVAALLGFGS